MRFVMSLHLWEAVQAADAHSNPLFDVDPELVESTPPSLQRVLLAAASLWCRTLTWPTVREISQTAAVAASTSIWAVGSSAGLRTVLVESERRTIDNLWLARIDGALSDTEAFEVAFRLRIRRLASIERSLAALPMLAGLVLGELPMAAAAMRPYHENIAEDLRSAREVA